LLAIALLGERVLTLIDYSRFSAQDSQTSLLITTGLVQATALVLVTAPLVIRRVMVRDHAR
jgi:hypothetical protein